MTTNPNASPLLALADRCEAASGPDRELDAWIDWTVNGYSGCPAEPNVYGDARGYWRERAGDPLRLAPPYTASIDAAMRLLDKSGVLMHLSDIGADGLPLARVGRPDLPDVPIFTGIASCIMTDTSTVAGLSLALCAAALRAQASETGRG